MQHTPARYVDAGAKQLTSVLVPTVSCHLTLCKLLFNFLIPSVKETATGPIPESSSEGCT